MDSPENKANHISVRVICLIVVIAVLLVVICFSLLGGGIDGEKPSTNPTVAYKKLTEYITPNTPSKPLESKEIVKRASQQEISGIEYYEKNANSSLPLKSVEGEWELLVGDDVNNPSQSLILKQDENRIEASLDGWVIHALVKGNVVLITQRHGKNNKQLRFRYRGVVSNSLDEIRGTLSISEEGVTKVEGVSWLALRQ